MPVAPRQLHLSSCRRNRFDKDQGRRLKLVVGGLDHTVRPTSSRLYLVVLSADRPKSPIRRDHRAPCSASGLDDHDVIPEARAEAATPVGLRGVPKCRRLAGWRRRSRRSRRSGVRSGTKPRAKMNSPVAYRQSLMRQRKTSFRKRRRMVQSGLDRPVCRERCANSNMQLVEPAIHSGFIVAIEPATVEIFSRENARAAFHAPVANRYPGVNPNVRAKRLA